MDPLPLKFEEIVYVDPLSRVQRKQQDARDAMKRCQTKGMPARVAGYEDDEIFDRKV